MLKKNWPEADHVKPTVFLTPAKDSIKVQKQEGCSYIAKYRIHYLNYPRKPS
jgi:hypothetical protein